MRPAATGGTFSPAVLHTSSANLSHYHTSQHGAGGADARMHSAPQLLYRPLAAAAAGGAAAAGASSGGGGGGHGSGGLFESYSGPSAAAAAGQQQQQQHHHQGGHHVLGRQLQGVHSPRLQVRVFVFVSVAALPLSYLCASAATPAHAQSICGHPTHATTPACEHTANSTPHRDTTIAAGRA
jgi:hypothetical protein